MAQPLTESPNYAKWSTTSLINRITELESQLRDQKNQTTTQAISSATNVLPIPAVPGTNELEPKIYRDIDPSKYHTRHIALKFAYLGQRYNGFEHTNGNKTPLPTIEEEIWKALRQARFIFPASLMEDDVVPGRGFKGSRVYTLDWEDCQYSKCGRTDKGVSAFGQVIGVRVRSARPKREPKTTASSVETATGTKGVSINSTKNITPPQSADIKESDAGDEVDDNWDDIRDELPYVQALNNILPPDIRVLAWCPHPPADFDARFSCRERQYRYFFTQPAFSPTPGNLGFIRSAAQHRGIAKKKLREGWLDIEAMREACKYFVGTHDFRNFCKVDTSKQITNFKRFIYHASIDLVDPRCHPLGHLGTPEFRPSQDIAEFKDEKSINEDSPSTPLVYTFTLHGSAFLWHQVRHMVAVLFLIGQGVESPSIIPELLDVSKNPRKPTYDMASDAPLVLWDCVFSDQQSGSREDALQWVYCGDPRQSNPSPGKGDNKFGPLGLVDNLWSLWSQRKMDEILAGALMDLVVSQGETNFIQNEPPKKTSKSQKIFNGGNEGKLGGVYVPIMQKPKTDTVEVQNARYSSTAKYIAFQERKAAKLKEQDQENGSE
ncbi:pseudouridylate synthase 3 [Talaromyces proteolyticus]|uniref:Pseudouridylate synthase 3 n=1 Tax=Talaromyces proteolyticus TaxID=1131652 RepID=A0AAD4KN80_9EURO|nr:pseudouridylate synthase 3 [Talaromyces proteolyticus]KAH8695431.1 pseudouridylate synthase 3 [Talaromyces proteolyticus]